MNSTAMQTTLHPDYTGTFTVNGHIVPVVQGIAMVLNGADVTAAQALGWTVLTNQPNIAEPTLMQPPAVFLMQPHFSGYANVNPFNDLLGMPDARCDMPTSFPDGTGIVLLDPPSKYYTVESPSSARKVCSVPAQWVEYAKAAYQFMPHPAF